MKTPERDSSRGPRDSQNPGDSSRNMSPEGEVISGLFAGNSSSRPSAASSSSRLPAPRRSMSPLRSFNDFCCFRKREMRAYCSRSLELIDSMFFLASDSSNARESTLSSLSFSCRSRRSSSSSRRSYSALAGPRQSHLRARRTHSAQRS